jgi:serine/threonine protein kinase
MHPERWRQVEQLYHAALEQEAGDRTAFLREACKRDDELRREVESLLAQHSSRDGMLEHPAADLLSDSPASHLAIGSQLGPYRIDRILGAGGMGEVYQAHDTRLGRDVAIKVSIERFSNRFEREATAVAALNHPNICHLYDVGPNYLVMELVEGRTLDERIREGSIPLDEALSIAGQIADALEAAHEKGIIHRDLKPANLKITPQGVVKVLDFGLAKAAAAPSAVEAPFTLSTEALPLTEAGTVLGTAPYMSPEQAQGKSVDKRVDIWAFGVVFYEMLTGRRPFKGDTASDTFVAVLTKEPDWDRVPAKAQLLLRRCLVKDPTRRLRDIGDAMALLQDAPELPPATRPWLAWSAAALFLLGFSVVSYIHFREQPEATSEAQRFQIPLPDKVRLQDNHAFSLSPDGRSLAFPAIGSDGVARMWVQTLDSLDARPLPSSEIAPSGTLTFWSPDSRFIVFQTQGKLKKVGLMGDPPQSICDIPGTLIGGSWSREDVIVFGTDTRGLLRVPAAGGAAAALTRLDNARLERVHGFPVFLPDGRHFLYSRFSNTLENNGIYVGSLDAKPEEQGSRRLTASVVGAVFVPFPRSGGGKVLFQRGSTLLAQTLDTNRLELTGEAAVVAEHVGSYRANGFFSAAANRLIYRSPATQTAQMTWFDRQGNVVGSVDEPYIHDAGPSLSPRGERVAFSRFDGTGVNIWLSELARGVSTRLTFDQGIHSAPVWSPDGSRVAFSSAAGGRYDLYQKSSNGTGGEELLYQSGDNKSPTSWSNDGRFLLYTTQDAKTGSDLWVLPMDIGAAGRPGDRKPFPIARTEFTESFGRFAPDSRWIAYVSNESGKNEVYVQPFTPPSAGGSSPAVEKFIVSRGGGTRSSWRGDGRELVYTTTEGKMMAVEIVTTPTFKAGIPQPLFQMPPSALGWDVSADVNDSWSLFRLARMVLRPSR